jgi:glycosyltransferase involved in cell wall biosynthesis
MINNSNNCTNEVSLVSVAFPIHKTNPYFIKALNSILNQSYYSLEILVLDSSLYGIDLSTFSDPRIVHVRLPSYFNLSQSLNHSIDLSRGKYLCRMDYDDISLPERIETQVTFLDRNPSISIVGSAVNVFRSDTDLTESLQLVPKPTGHEDILEMMLYKTGLFHPTVMIRLQTIRAFQLRYREKYDGAEDYDLWVRAAHRKVLLGNLEEPLLQLRSHDGQFSKIDSSRSNFRASKVRFRHLMWMFTHGKIGILPFIKQFKFDCVQLARTFKSKDFFRHISKFDK